MVDAHLFWVQSAQIVPAQAKSVKLLSDLRQVNTAELWVLAHNQKSLEVPRQQVSTIVHHHSVDLVDQEEEALRVGEATLDSLIGNDARLRFVSILVHVVPNEGSVDCDQIVKGTVLGWLVVREAV